MGISHTNIGMNSSLSRYLPVDGEQHTRCIKQCSDKILATCQILVTCPDYTNISACNSECFKLDFLGSCGPRVCVFWYDTNNFHDKSISKIPVVTMFVFFGTTQIISMTG